MNSEDKEEKIFQEFSWKRNELIKQLAELKNYALELGALEKKAKSDPIAARKLDAIETTRNGLVRASRSVQLALTSIKQVEERRKHRKNLDTTSTSKKIVKNLNTRIA